MASGITVADAVKDVFNQMKVVKSTDNEEDRIRLVVLHICKEIEVEKIYTQKDLEGLDVTKFFKEMVPKSDCRYYLYDCHFETEEGIKKKDLVFMLWAPGDAGCRCRMQYASSKGAMDRIVTGVKHNFQINEITDLDDDTFADKLADNVGKKLLSLEGKDLCRSHKH